MLSVVASSGIVGQLGRWGFRRMRAGRLPLSGRRGHKKYVSAPLTGSGHHVPLGVATYTDPNVLPYLLPQPSLIPCIPSIAFAMCLAKSCSERRSYGDASGFSRTSLSGLISKISCHGSRSYSHARDLTISCSLFFSVSSSSFWKVDLPSTIPLSRPAPFSLASRRVSLGICFFSHCAEREWTAEMGL
jgi:hypothetical protein